MSNQRRWEAEGFEIEGWELDLWNNFLLKIFLVSLLIGLSLLVQPALADVVQKECPFSCDSENLDSSECRDWKEGTQCFVDHVLRFRDSDTIRGRKKLVLKAINGDVFIESIHVFYKSTEIS